MINTETKVLIMELREIFRHARQKLGWAEKYGDQAFGINRTILNYVIGSKSKLLIRFIPNQDQEYWITFDIIRKFTKKVPCMFFVSKTKRVYNIPLSLFKIKPNFSGVKQ